MFETAYKTYSGRRDNNEDSIFVNGEIYSSDSGYGVSDECLLAVCDGVGGECYGEEASNAACKVLGKYVGMQFTEELANRYISEANDFIREEQKKDALHGKMSTTAAVIYIKGNDVFAFNLGDSEIMRLRGNMLYRISEKHTVIDEFQKFGLETSEADRHVITKYLGGRNFEPAVFNGEGTLDENDVFILFSDGVGDVMSKSDIKQILLSDIPLNRMCEEICDTALKKGSDDNISVIITRRMRE